MKAQTTEKLQYFERTQTQDQKDFLKMNNHCVLCGQVLEFQFEKKQEVCEEIRELTHCPQCQLQSKSRFYIIQ